MPLHRRQQRRSSTTDESQASRGMDMTTAPPPIFEPRVVPPVPPHEWSAPRRQRSSSFTSVSGSEAGDKAQMDDRSDHGCDDDALGQVLAGAEDIRPLDKKSSGESQAVQLGYPSKLVSKWYEHRCPAGACPDRSSEFDNVDEEDADLRARTKSVPILHQHRLSNGHWITQSFTVQDPVMRSVLRSVLARYQDLDMGLTNWTFAPPFMPLVHRWEQLKAYYTDLQEKDDDGDEKDDSRSKNITAKKNAAAALLSFLAPIIAPSVISLNQTHKAGKVSFRDIWQIFPPGTTVVTEFYGVPVVCRVVGYKKKEHPPQGPGWQIKMEYVDWNGERAGWTTTKTTIFSYSGLKRVTGLPVYPLSFAADEDRIRADMTDRGCKWAGLRGYHFKIINGTKIVPEGRRHQQRPIAGKVCIDAYAYYRTGNLLKPYLRPLVSASKRDAGADTSSTSSSSSSSSAGSDTLSSQNYKASFTITQGVPSGAQAKGPAERDEELSPMSDDEMLMTTPWVKGFDLKSKDFCEINVAEVQDMRWNDDAFDKLVLPGGEKELAWTFVENKSQLATSSASSGFDDFIPDKGRGLIILMFGPPGVGKTFTAEAVSERSRVPLYSMSAGDLGVHPADVEASLGRALELCRMWNAMLLLDEADVFLGERTGESLARNELVSIFLTKLEYYQGILFLTTNRIASIDHAFQSRVDLFLPYRDLLPEARRQVWENFIERAGKDRFDMSDASLEELSQLRLNGREIKNLVKSAQLLSMKNLGGKVPADRLLLLANKRVEALKELDTRN